MIEPYQSTRLWSKAFKANGDGQDSVRENLATALSDFRTRVGKLVGFIPADMKHYTVHDLTHLDALWEMADLIVSEDFVLNPAEAFVFGGAVLLHDAGMTLAAYPDGKKYLQATQEWQDAFSIHAKKAKSLNKGHELSAEAQQEAVDLATTDALRLLHAKKAEELATQFWEDPETKAQVYLIQNEDIRHHFGQTIGVIAHSHHWPMRNVVRNLHENLGAFGDMPPTWVVDKVKVAALLRCADAVHIDSRRAPKLLQTLTRPEGISRTHWQFQSKLAKPQYSNSRLVYTSVSPFKTHEAEAWQLCLDTIRMIDRELSDAADALEERNVLGFRVNGVVGAKSPETLAQYVQVEGWRPVPTEIQVSDVPSLARTLGGDALYSFAFAPLRELLQNAADAVEARASIDPDFALEDGAIVVRVSTLDSGDVCLDVEDNGIGMSERTLSLSLLDFGQSFWASDAAKHEHPGLSSKFHRPRGRFGIGFFSTFMWSNHVLVVSRRYDAGRDDARVLEFKQGLGKRPIIRQTSKDEFSTKVSTKVSLVVSKDTIKNVVNSEPIMLDREYVYPYGIRSMSNPSKTWAELIRLVCGTLDISVYLETSSGREVVNLPKWASVDEDEFVKYYEKIAGGLPKFIRKFSKSVSEIKEGETVVGRAFLRPKLGESYGSGTNLCVYERGIFIGFARVDSVSGLLEGSTTNAARDSIKYPNLHTKDDWFNRQKDYLFRIASNEGEMLACQESLLAHGRFDESKILFALDRKFLSLSQVCDSVRQTGRIWFRLKKADSSTTFTPGASEHLSILTGKKLSSTQLFFLTDIPGEFDSEAGDDVLAAISDSPFRRVMSAIILAIGPYRVQQETVNVNSYSNEKALIVVLSRDDKVAQAS